MFRNGESEKSTFSRLAAWLQNGDTLCVWHMASREILEQAWRDTFHSSVPYPILCADRKVHRIVQSRDNMSGNLYSIAQLQGVSVELPWHCSKYDIAVLRELFLIIGLSQKRLWKEYVQVDCKTSVQRNKAILMTIHYNYICIPGSQVFHTRNCPCILNAKRIEGSFYYKTASDKRRPCKLCKPKPDMPTEMAERQENIEARLLGGIVTEVRRGNIIGCCHNIVHPGKLTKAIMEEHDCIGKQCKFFEKYEDNPFWKVREKKQVAKVRAKKRKKEEKAILLGEAESLIKMRDDFQKYADLTDSPIKIIRVNHSNHHVYTVFYVSDNRFADGNRFLKFIEALKRNYSRCRVVLRHIKDVDGHFVTRDEYYARKR